MAWTYFPLSVGDFPAEAVWQELIDAINERCVFAGLATLTSPAAGDNWFTGTQVSLMQQKIEDLVPNFIDPDSTIISGASVTFVNWTFANIIDSLNVGSYTDWTAYTRQVKLPPPWYGATHRQATGGDLGALISFDMTAMTFWDEMYQVLNKLRWTMKTVSWGGDDQDLRWMTNRPDRIFIPPASSGSVLGESTAQDYVEDHWASGAWWDLSSGIPPVPNTVNGAYMAMLNLSFYEFDDSMKWGEARWIRDSSGVHGPDLVVGGGPFDPTGLVTPPDDAAEIELMRARNRLIGGVVSGSAVQVFGYQVPYTHGADYLNGTQNETRTTGNAEKISIATDHTSGALTASGLGYDDTRPTPTPALADIGGGYPARMDETYYELNAEVLIELDFDKMT